VTYPDDAQERWPDQFRFDNVGRRKWDPEYPTPQSPTEAELDEAAETLRGGRGNR
jgi:hypothetical protein